MSKISVIPSSYAKPPGYSVFKDRMDNQPNSITDDEQNYAFVLVKDYLEELPNRMPEFPRDIQPNGMSANIELIAMSSNLIFNPFI